MDKLVLSRAAKMAASADAHGPQRGAVFNRKWAPMAKGENATQLTWEAAAQIRGLIIDRVLLPGEKIRQVDVAERVGVSRSPLREALRTLEGEGVVTYEENRGYVVARLDDSELEQIHRMRDLLESELLRSVQKPNKKQLDELRSLNAQLTEAIAAQDVGEILRCNRAFHYAIFELSPLNQFRREVQRLWQLSDYYSAAWWRRRPEIGSRIIAEHKAIIAALRKHDLQKLVEVSDAHRGVQYDAQA